MTSSSTINDTSPDLTIEPESLATAKFYLNILEFYFVPVLIHFGIIGNCLSVFVILRTKLRNLSSSCYLLTLSVSDTIFLCMLSTQWFAIAMNDLDVFKRPVMCQLIIYLSDICGSLSVWLIVALTAERFVAVVYPLKSKYMCTVRRAKLITGTLIAFIAVVYSPLLLIAKSDTTTTNRTVCVPRPEMHRVASALNFFDTVFTCLVPVCAIAALNTVICRNIWFFSHLRRKMTQCRRNDSHRRTEYKGGGGGGGDGGLTDKEDAFSIKCKSVYRLTKMILIISTVWLALNAPSYVMRFIAHLQTLKIVNIENNGYTIFTVVQRYFQILFYTNFAITFALYCISGRNFRKAAASLFCSGRLMKAALGKGGGRRATDRTHSVEILTYQSTVRIKRPAKSEDHDVAI